MGTLSSTSNPLWPLACSRDLAVNHCWAVTQLWPPCGVRMFVPGWVLSPESDCCMASPTCGHPASCGSSVLLFLCLKMAAAAWHSRQQVAGGSGPFRPLGGRLSGREAKARVPSSPSLWTQPQVGKSTSCSVRRALLSLLSWSEEVLNPVPVPWPLRTELGPIPPVCQ